MAIITITTNQNQNELARTLRHEGIRVGDAGSRAPAVREDDHHHYGKDETAFRQSSVIACSALVLPCCSKDILSGIPVEPLVKLVARSLAKWSSREPPFKGTRAK